MSQHQEQPLPVKWQDAVRYMTKKQFIVSPKHQAQHYRAERKGAHPDLLAFERAFLRRMKKLGIPMFAHCVMRSDEVQRLAFLQGKSLAGPGQSPHQYGRAVDLVHGVYAWNVPKLCWDVIGHIGKEVAKTLGVKVRWGGDFKSLYDPAHWELEDWRHYPTDPQVSTATLDYVLALYGLDGTRTEGGPEWPKSIL